MAVSTDNAYSGPYAANGVTTVFPFTFTAPTASEVGVLVRDADGEDVAPGTYSVSINAGSGGSITFDTAPANGLSVIPYLSPEFTQDLLFEDGSAWLASPVNEGYDRGALRDQVLKRDLGRSMLVPLGETAPSAKLSDLIDGDILQYTGGVLTRLDRSAFAGMYYGGDGTGKLVPLNGTGNDAALRTDLVSDLGSTLVMFLASAVGAVSRTLRAKLFDSLSVKDFGAIGDGTVDDAAKLNVAFGSTEVSEIHLPKGTYYIESASALIDGKIKIRASKGAVIKAAPGLLEAVKIGSVTMFEGQVHGLRLEKAAYDGGTENIGFAYHNLSNASFYDCEARQFKYAHRAVAGDGQRVAYSLWSNCQSHDHYYGFSANITGTGYANENTFIGGRFSPTANSKSHVHLPTGNHWRFFGLAAEGHSGGNLDQGFYFGSATHSCMAVGCRTEGTYAVSDYVVASGAIATYIDAWNLYANVSDSGTGTAFDLYTQGLQRVVGAGNVVVGLFRRTGSSTDATKPVLLVEDLGGSSDSFGIRTRLNRFTSASWHWLAERATDNFLVGKLDAFGNFFVGRRYEQDQSAYNLGHNRHGIYREWYDGFGMKRVKASSDPASATDGEPLGRKVAVPATATSAGAPGQWAADTTNFYSYTGDGTTHSWRRVAHAAW